MKSIQRIAFVLSLLMLASTIALAQLSAGSRTNTVTDSTGDALVEIGPHEMTIAVTGFRELPLTHVTNANGTRAVAATNISVSFSPKLFVAAPSNDVGIAKEILIDGANATNPASGGVAFNGLSAVESIGEFKPNNHIFAAEYRRTDGDSEPFVTQSGGSQFHGSAYDFHTNSALDAATGTGKADSTAANPVFRKTPFHSNN